MLREAGLPVELVPVHLENFDLAPFPKARAYMERVEARLAVREALLAEGLRR